jgi:hypothetical protein
MNKTTKEPGAVKKIAFIVSMLLVMLWPCPAPAADALYRMLHTDEVESFRADQDGIIVGQLSGRNGGSFTVRVIKVVSGAIPGSNIAVIDDFAYGFGATPIKPQVNDYCVMSLKKTGAYYKKAWGVYRASSGDYRTLKLLPEDTGYYAGAADIAAIEWYINSGGVEKDFFFREESAFVVRPNGETVKIYPKEKELIEKNPGGDPIKAENTGYDAKPDKWLLFVPPLLVCLLLIPAAVAYRQKK